MSPDKTKFALLAASLALTLPHVAQAQALPYGDVGGGSSSSSASADDDGEDGDADAPRRGSRRVEFSPYIEAGAVALFELSPGSDTVTYSAVAAGVDASVNGRNNQASVSLRKHQLRLGGN